MESKMKFGKKFAFGLGDFGGNFCFSFISSFALIYFTDIAGANVLAISTLLLIAKALDGITDLITGHLIDKTHSKMGKARPWLFWSAFPLAIAMILLFSVPGDLGQQAKSAYIFIFYVLVCAFFYTANNISYNALTALITNNEEDRVSMGSIRFMLTAVAGIIIGTLTTVLVQIFGTGQKGWTAVAALYAVIFLICTMITVFSVKEVNNSSVEGQRKNEVGWVQSVKILLTNRYFILVFIIFLVMYIFTGLIGTAGTYYAKYILGNENMYGLLSIAMMIPMFLSLLFTPAPTKKFGMQKTGIGAGMLFIIGSLAGVIGGSSLPILLSGIVIRSFGMGPISAIIVTLSASVSDNIILKKKVNIEGMTFSCSSVGIKIGSGVGTALVGWLLAAVGYNGKDITDGAITMIQISYLFIPVILGILVIVCFLFMNIEEENKRLRSGSR